MVKYDTTVYDVCKVGCQNSLSLQQEVDELDAWTKNNDMQINPKKTKEMVINFTKEAITQPLTIEGEPVECVKETKLLGVYLNDKLNWNTHIDETYAKAAKRLFLLVQLRRAGLAQDDLCKYYKACIRSVLEYACQVFHGGLTREQSESLESIQKRALRIINPHLSYSEALVKLNIETLSDRRTNMCEQLFTQIQKPDHKLNVLLPPKNDSKYNLRNSKPLCLPRCKTNRYKNSFIPWCVYNLQ